MCSSPMVRLMLALLCVLSACATAHAEPFPLTFVAPPNAPQDVRDSLQLLARKYANGMYKLLQERIDQIDSVCDLTDQQRSRLLLAAKGSAQDTLEEWVGPIRVSLASATPGVMEVVAIRLQLQSAEGRAVVMQNQVQVVQQRVMVGGNEFIRARRIAGAVNHPPQVLAEANALSLDLDESAVLCHEIFRVAVKSALTPEQGELLKAADFESGGSVRTDRLMTLLATRLSLATDQRQEIRLLVDNLVDQKVQEWQAGLSPLSSVEIADAVLVLLPEKEMQRILSPVQYRLWRRFIEQSRPVFNSLPARSQ